MLTKDMTVRKKAHELCLKVLRLRKTMMLRIPPSIPPMNIGRPTPMTTLFKSSEDLGLDDDIVDGCVRESEASVRGYKYEGESASVFQKL